MNRTSADIYTAISTNDVIYLQQLLMDSSPVNLDAPLYGSFTAMHIAAEKGNTECIEILLSYGAHVDVTDEYGYTPLMSAVSAGYLYTVHKLIKHLCNCNTISHCGLTALHMAARFDSTELVRPLLLAGASPNVWTNTQESPVSMAIAKGSSDIVQDMLLGCHYANPNRLAKTELCPTPVKYSMELNYYDIVRTLLLSGYRGHLELHQYMSRMNDDEKLTILPKLHDSVTISISLQNQCRLKIRHLLKYNIWTKCRLLTLPQSVKDFILFDKVMV